MNIRATPLATFGFVSLLPAEFSCHHMSSFFISAAELLLVSGGYTAAKWVLLLLRAPCKETLPKTLIKLVVNYLIFQSKPRGGYRKRERKEQRERELLMPLSFPFPHTIALFNVLFVCQLFKLVFCYDLHRKLANHNLLLLSPGIESADV